MMIKIFLSFATLATAQANADYAQDEADRHRDEEDEAHSVENLKAQFKRYDVNGDGLLDAAEIRFAFHNKIDPATIFQFFLRVDKDQSGTMSETEYLNSQAAA
jgi:hypothetical protein